MIVEYVLRVVLFLRILLDTIQTIDVPRIFTTKLIPAI